MNARVSRVEGEARVLIPDMASPPRPVRGAHRIDMSGEAFATTWRMTLHVDGEASIYADMDAFAAVLRRRAEAWLGLIDAQMSPYRADSDLTRFNQAADWSFVPLPPVLMQLMRHALEMALLTDGAFNPVLLPAVELWGFGSKVVEPGLPPEADIAALQAAKHDWRDLIWQPDGLIRPEGVKLDLCAIAKGFAADGLMQMVQSHAGVCAALIEVGGELKGFGVQPDGLPWWVELETPKGAQTASERTLIALCDWAVATSGDSRRAFVHDGQVLSHTIDARTQSPAVTGITSATVFDAQGWRADALATALIVMGPDAARDFARAHNIPCLLWLRDETGTVFDWLSPVVEGWL